MQVKYDDNGTLTARIMVPLTDLERRTFAADLADTIGKRGVAQAELKSMSDTAKSKIKGLEQSIEILGYTLRVGKIEREMAVRLECNWAQNIKEVYSVETGELVGEMPLSDEDRQLRLSPDAPRGRRKAAG